MRFTWDETKRQRTLAKHGVDFVAAATIFDRPRREAQDTRKSYGEMRVIATGVASGTMLTVVYTMRAADLVRIISARRANRNEREAYRKAYPS